MSNNFMNMVKEAEQQINKENQVFDSDENNPQKIIIADLHKLFNRPLLPHEEQMIRNIQKVDDYSWKRGKNGGPTTGFEGFDMAIDGGISPSFILFAASPNVGKSAIVLQIIKNIADRNDHVFCEYLSLDDSLNLLMPRYIACDQAITISQAKNPQRFAEEKEIIEKRNNSIKKLYKNAHKFVMKDNSEGSSVEYLRKHIEELRMTLPEDIPIIIGIDSYYDLTIEEKCYGEKNEQEKIAKAVKDITTDYNVTILATAHLRKLNGDRRPTTDDLKENNRLEFEADLICLLYNEVGIKQEAAQIYWIDEENEELKMPVLEMRFAKNKISDFKGHLFYEMIPAKNIFVESSEEARRQYASRLYQ